MPDVHLVATLGEYKGSQLTCTVLDSLIQTGWEGLLLKSVTSLYEPGHRSRDWIKYKCTGKTIDAIVLSGKLGRGKLRTKLASFEIGVLDQYDSYTPLGHVGTGFDERTLDEMNALLRIGARVIIEVHAEALTKSKAYPRGVSLRFPSFKRFRFDLSQPNTLAEVCTQFGHTAIP